MYRGSDRFLGLFPFKLEPLHRTLNRRTAGTRSSADELVRFDQTPKFCMLYLEWVKNVQDGRTGVFVFKKKTSESIIKEIQYYNPVASSPAHLAEWRTHPTI